MYPGLKSALVNSKMDFKNNNGFAHLQASLRCSQVENMHKISSQNEKSSERKTILVEF
jgi:hypothetical protein